MDPNELEETYLTVAEVAEKLKLNQQTVRNWIDQGALPALRVGRRVRIRRSDFERILAEGYTGGSGGSEASGESGGSGPAGGSGGSSPSGGSGSGGGSGAQQSGPT